MSLLHGFELLRQQDIPELNIKALLYRHAKTGAELLSLENDDENKVFGITFRTPPKDSTGVAHIMEHAVLCGSRKYPVKEPFKELIKGSLNTFVNAMTYPDKTCYPVASQNRQDLYNLIEVYLDAVFHPLITPQAFQQEGWHYETESPAQPLRFKGVVFNEMKGAYSSPDRLLAEYSQQSLFPGHVYGVDSGGHPHHIPDLTYEQFKKFHQTYYHPSNSRIFFYGDDKSADRLRLLDEFLREFDYLEVDSSIPLQSEIGPPRRLTYKYSAGEEEASAGKGRVTVNWLLPESTDPTTMLTLNLLAHILVGTPAAPLYKALIDSGLGEDVTGGGLSGELRQMYFSTGLKGIEVKNADRVETLILQVLNDLAQKGIDPQTIAASMNTIEFRLREQNTGSYPRGLLLMLSALTTWLHGGDPIAPLAFEAPLAGVKRALSGNSRFFEEMIARHFLRNQHRTRVVLEPDPELAQREEAAEKARLAKTRQGMTDEVLQATIASTRELKQQQEAPDPAEALAKIPSLKLADLDTHNKTIPIVVQEQNGLRMLYHDLFTNGVVYLDAGFDLHAVPQELLPYVPLFSRALLETGTEQEDFVRLSQRIGRTTGGIFPSSFTSMILDRDSATAWLFLRGKAMMSQTEDLLAILRDVLLTARLDNQERFRQMVLDEKAGEEAGLVPRGHGVVSTRLSACFHEAGWLSEQMSGVSYLFFLRNLAKQVDSNWPEVRTALETIREHLISRNNMLCNVTLDEANWKQFEPQLLEFSNQLPVREHKTAPWTPKLGSGFEGMTIPAQVNYVGKAANLYKLGYRFHGSVLVINKYLGTTWLWERVRMQGGAYGGFSGFSRASGVFSFLSYRDPNLLGTLENYDAAGQFLRQVDLTDDDLRKSIIGAIGDLDFYQLPDAKGRTSMRRYLVGDTDEARQQMREEVLSTTVADFRAFGDLLQQFNEHALVVVLGSAGAIETVNQERPGWLTVTKVL